MSITAEQAVEVFRASECLHDEAAVGVALDRMVEEIRGAIAGKDAVALVVMNGGFIPAAGLLLRLDLPLRVDYLHATRYREGTSGGLLDWKRQPEVDFADREVLVIDDILDEGQTLAAIVDYCREQGAGRVWSAVLVEKLRPRAVDFVADFVGLTVPDRYVFGYGMDYKGYLRNVRGIYAVADPLEAGPTARQAVT
jgi:hypoxanthine phosphoribosyltransferase